jgi:hypothetical protein
MASSDPHANPHTASASVSNVVTMNQTRVSLNNGPIAPRRFGEDTERGETKQTFDRSLDPLSPDHGVGMRIYLHCGQLATLVDHLAEKYRDSWYLRLVHTLAISPSFRWAKDLQLLAIRWLVLEKEHRGPLFTGGSGIPAVFWNVSWRPRTGRKGN